MGRVLDATGLPHLVAFIMTPRRVYWSNIQNFGDRLTVPLLAKFAGIEAKNSRPKNAEIVGIGSILEQVPEEFEGTILGAGFMFEKSRLDLRKARVLLVRGVLTADRISVKAKHIGDLGILANTLIEEVAVPEFDIGWIPHRVDPRRISGSHYIDLSAPVENVIREASRCRRIQSSSLHGLILADALERPRCWDPCPRVQGNGFKFRDYASSLGEVIHQHTWALCNHSSLESLRNAVLLALKEIRGLYARI